MSRNAPHTPADSTRDVLGGWNLLGDVEPGPTDSLFAARPRSATPLKRTAGASTLDDPVAGKYLRAICENLVRNLSQIKRESAPLPTLSLWEGPETLRAFVYQSGHVEIMKRRSEWLFELRTNPPFCGC